MRRAISVALGVGLVAFVGCAHEDHLKAPQIEHEYVLPPSNDPRFSSYPKFPDKTLNEAPRKGSLESMGMPKTSPRMGGPGGGF